MANKSTSTVRKIVAPKAPETAQTTSTEQEVEISMNDYRKWVTTEWLTSLSDKDRKQFDSLSLDAKRETSMKAYKAFLAKPKEEAQRETKVAEDKGEQVGIRVTEGDKLVVVEIEDLPPSTNKGIPSPESPRGKVLAQKRLDAQFIGGKVVILKDDYQRWG